jgi:shikimate kinase
MSGDLAIPSEQNIVLTGFMGVGKTTVGRVLAEMLERPFVDTDAVIVERAGKPIKAIFAEDGEAAFREMEHDLSVELAARTRLVIATGGGMVIDPMNRQALEQSGFLVCLDAPPSVVEERLSHSAERPLAVSWRKRFEQRRIAYAAIHHHIDVEGKSPQSIAQEIIALWQPLP